MLIVLPPSETKRPPPDEGSPVDLGTLSFPSLTPMRRRILRALSRRAPHPTAFRRLQVGPSLAHEVVRNTWLTEQPTRPAFEVYTGPLYEALDGADLSPAARARAERQARGDLAALGRGPTDRPYHGVRLDVCSRLLGMDRLEPTWRTVLPAALCDAAASRGPIVDLRWPSYQGGGDARRTGSADGHRAGRSRRRRSGRVPDDPAKRTRGALARHLLEADADPRGPEDLAPILGDRWSVELTPPSASGERWTLTVAIPV